jgi:hypothetical protein
MTNNLSLSGGRCSNTEMHRKTSESILMRLINNRPIIELNINIPWYIVTIFVVTTVVNHTPIRLIIIQYIFFQFAITLD